MAFNPNELILERIRSVEEYDISTGEILGRYTQIESPTLTTTATGTDVVDAMGSPITTFYNAQQGTFEFTNSLFSLDLAASQYGTTKTVADVGSEIEVPVSEVITLSGTYTAVLSYVPVGTAGAEVKYATVISDANEFGTTYEVSATAGAGKFTLDAATKTLTFPDGTTGKVFVNYVRKSSTAVSVAKTTDAVPETKTLLIHAIFHDKCNTNTVYAGIIRCPRAQIDPSSVAIGLQSDSKHAASYKLQKAYCDSTAKLFDIIVAQD